MFRLFISHCSVDDVRCGIATAFTHATHPRFTRYTRPHALPTHTLLPFTTWLVSFVWRLGRTAVYAGIMRLHGCAAAARRVPPSSTFIALFLRSARDARAAYPSCYENVARGVKRCRRVVGMAWADVAFVGRWRAKPNSPTAWREPRQRRFLRATLPPAAHAQTARHKRRFPSALFFAAFAASSNFLFFALPIVPDIFFRQTHLASPTHHILATCYTPTTTLLPSPTHLCLPHTPPCTPRVSVGVGVLVREGAA